MKILFRLKLIKNNLKIFTNTLLKKESAILDSKYFSPKDVSQVVRQFYKYGLLSTVHQYIIMVKPMAL
jgi:hypothetical protein